MSVYKRQNGGITYYSTKAVDPDADLKKKLANIDQGFDLGLLTQEEVTAKKAALNATPADVEEVPATAENLKNITRIRETIAPISTQLRAAQIEMMVDLLKQTSFDFTVEELRDMTGVSPKDVREWCKEPAPKGKGIKKSGADREGLSTSVLRKLDDMVAEAALKAPGRKKAGA